MQDTMYKYPTCDRFNVARVRHQQLDNNETSKLKQKLLSTRNWKNSQKTHKVVLIGGTKAVSGGKDLWNR